MRIPAVTYFSDETICIQTVNLCRYGLVCAPRCVDASTLPVLCCMLWVLGVDPP
jgi:hypothetical protein